MFVVLDPTSNVYVYPRTEAVVDERCVFHICAFNLFVYNHVFGRDLICGSIKFETVLKNYAHGRSQPCK